jgi:hypothetical protein
MFVSFNAHFHFNGCVVPSFPFPWANFSWNDSFLRVAYRKSAKGEGSYLLEAWAIPDSRVFALWPLASCVNSPEVWVETYSAHLQWNFLHKMGPFLGGVPPQ